MKVYSAEDVAQRLPYPALIECLRSAFFTNAETPPRSMFQIPLESGKHATFGVMPAWRSGELMAAKLISLMPDNAERGLPSIHAVIVLFDGVTGVPTAVLDGTEITRRRTAAASALAASYLAIEDAADLLIVGTGAQAFHQTLAHAAVRPIRRIAVWGRSPQKARSVVDALQQVLPSVRIAAVDDLAAAVGAARIISCVTSAAEPVVLGRWLSPGTFLDLVGSHTPDRRECDDDAVRRSRIYVDTLAGALSEAGDLLIPIDGRVILRSDVIGDLHALCSHEDPGRRSSGEIIIFKSVGSALEDLAAANLVANGSHLGRPSVN